MSRSGTRSSRGWPEFCACRPPQSQALIGGFLDGRIDAPALQKGLAAQAVPAPIPASAIAVAANDRQLVSSVAGGLVDKADAPARSSDMLYLAEKMVSLERVLAASLPAEQRAGLIRAARPARRQLTEEQRDSLVRRVAATVEAWDDPRYNAFHFAVPTTTLIRNTSGP